MEYCSNTSEEEEPDDDDDDDDDFFSWDATISSLSRVSWIMALNMGAACSSRRRFSETTGELLLLLAGWTELYARKWSRLRRIIVFSGASNAANAEVDTDASGSGSVAEGEAGREMVMKGDG